MMESTSVETQSFYLMSDSGYLGLAQVIYSNVAYVGISFSTVCWQVQTGQRLLTEHDPQRH